ncbi:hypothetical protein AB0K52_01315 [Glycomyces sp. NPDC049804]|uniref:hypothetical protein n=1 Tax=Glycomyces sp. NPDC049804 TaxID=3154363 RepID=UPI003432A9D3
MAVGEYRAFDPASDGIALLHERYLHPGEVVRWTAQRAEESYFVDGLRENGKPRRRGPLRVLLAPVKAVWTVFLRIAEFSACLSDFDFSNYPRRKRLPTVIVFGGTPDCTAVVRSQPSHGSDQGLWLLTDRRFAVVSFTSLLESGQREPFLELRNRVGRPAEPMRFQVEFEVAAAQIRYQPHAERRFSRKYRPRSAMYHRVLLSDESGFDIDPGPTRGRHA